jgi:hypothetical protein
MIFHSANNFKRKENKKERKKEKKEKEGIKELQ